jgi:chorismate mutase
MQDSPSKRTFSPLQEWFSTGPRPALIAGPCSAESPLQLLEVARFLSGLNADTVLRAGIWKPRTRPGNFEGPGESGLAWLADAGRQNGLRVITEVANASHVELCLKHGIDMLWIGARTVVNPFSVQEIADALRGTDIPVFIKNPIHPDLDLWAGAIERINAAGIKKVVAVHRGFHIYGKKRFRNSPQWEIPIRLMEDMPDLPFFCDPSHISGKRSLVPGIAQKAMDLGMSGLMVEVHPDPDKAKSDARQQLSLQGFSEMISGLQVRALDDFSLSGTVALEKLREQIDRIDADIIQLLAERIGLSREIGVLKKEKNLTIFQIRRWKKIMRTQLQSGELLGVDEQFVRAVYQLIHQDSIRIQSEIMNKKPETAKELRA